MASALGAFVVTGCDAKPSAQALDDAPARETASSAESSAIAASPSAAAAASASVARSASASAAAASSSALAARGNMWGDEIGDAFGAGGLGLTGIGEGGGGRGEGIGLGSIGSIGHGAGTGTGKGFGSGSGRLGGSRGGKPPSVRMGATSVSGRLPPEVIQRIVRQNFGRFRLCYENGLRANPGLEGQVTVGFTIGSDGSVSDVKSVPPTDLKDNGVVQCVTKAFHGLSFPQPEGGVVKVTYPIKFAPGEPAPAKVTIDGKALAVVTAADLEKALRDAGFEDVKSAPKVDAKDAFTITAKKGGKTFTVTFVPAAAAADALPATELARLAKDAVVMKDGTFYLAVESDDKKESQSVLDAIVKR